MYHEGLEPYKQFVERHGVVRIGKSPIDPSLST